MEAGWEPVSSQELGSFLWSFYEFELRGNPLDLAVAQAEGVALHVLLVSPPDEHEGLYAALFLPALQALAPLG